MKYLVFFFLFFCCSLFVRSQNITGKWFGYALQDTGELCTTCDFELDLTHKKSIWGQSGRTIDRQVNIRFNISGYVDKKDSIRLDENKGWLIVAVNPPDWQACVNHYNLKYHKIGTAEYLLGDGTGRGIDDNRECVPALMIFAKTKADLHNYLALHKDSLMAILIPPKREELADEPLPAFTPAFNNTITSKVTEIQVEHTGLEIQLRDYLREDNDTVSIYLNRRLIAGKKRISSKAISIKFNIRKGVSNELLLFAENLGLVPPNTSEMYLIDGKKSYRIMIESDKQKTAAVYLRYKR